VVNASNECGVTSVVLFTGRRYPPTRPI